MIEPSFNVPVLVEWLKNAPSSSAMMYEPPVVRAVQLMYDQLKRDSRERSNDSLVPFPLTASGEQSPRRSGRPCLVEFWVARGGIGWQSIPGRVALRAKQRVYYCPNQLIIIECERSRDLWGTSQFIHNPSAFNIENLDTRLSLGFLNEKLKQVYVAVQSAFKRSKTVEDIQREMSLRCMRDFWASVSENGAKSLTRRGAARLQNPILPFQTLMDRIESENQNGTEVLTRRWHHIVHFAASRRTASKRNINIQNVGVQDQHQVSGLFEERERQ
ncbi:hypothetical protein C8F04DRAFT_1188111 [Mycena alexandri]|uniref:Uncharacterized protein n=1 Tax=Mycena alexandri TaxID=1745969 RepID=A0AAD6SK13_9AGAR|nr:hypothetical protein C8F04DRAFT_1188111 [Mycena alexandri]